MSRLSANMHKLAHSILAIAFAVAFYYLMESKMYDESRYLLLLAMFYAFIRGSFNMRGVVLIWSSMIILEILAFKIYELVGFSRDYTYNYLSFLTHVIQEALTAWLLLIRVSIQTKLTKNHSFAFEGVFFFKAEFFIIIAMMFSAAFSFFALIENLLRHLDDFGLPAIDIKILWERYEEVKAVFAGILITLIFYNFTAHGGGKHQLKG